MKTKKHVEELGVVAGGKACKNIHDLLDWQILQYRKSVDEYRVELSKEQHRCVSWQEAEQQFSHMGVDRKGEQWRVEYCGLVCRDRNSCLLAMQFLTKHHVEPIHMAS